MKALLAVVLKPLAALYGSVVRARNAAYDRGRLRAERSALPVISVGNLSAGGNAKTPLAMLVAARLAQRGFKPVILSRGYKGAARGGPRLVDRGDAASDAGDEPLLMAILSGLPVVVSPDRVAGARFIEQCRLGSVIILDDGFQHRRLARDLDIVAVNVTGAADAAAFAKGQLLPLGRFREPRDPALARAGVLVAVRRSSAPDKNAGLASIAEYLPRELPKFEASLVQRPPVPSEAYFTQRSEGALTPCEIAVFCGIANPEGFFLSLEAGGFKLRSRRVYGDHHAFTPRDLADLRADAAGVPLVCTAKDAVKLRGAELPKLFVLPMELALQAEDELIELVSRAATSPAPSAP